MSKCVNMEAVNTFAGIEEAIDTANEYISEALKALGFLSDNTTGRLSNKAFDGINSLSAAQNRLSHARGIAHEALGNEFVEPPEEEEAIVPDGMKANWGAKRSRVLDRAMAIQACAQVLKDYPLNNALMEGTLKFIDHCASEIYAEIKDAMLTEWDDEA